MMLGRLTRWWNGLCESVDWRVSRRAWGLRSGVRGHVPLRYRAEELRERAAEFRVRAARYRGTEDADIGDVCLRDADRLEYAAELARIRYEAKQLAGFLVYDIRHCPDGAISETARARLAEQAQAVWDTLAYGDENA